MPQMPTCSIGLSGATVWCLCRLARRSHVGSMEICTHREMYCMHTVASVRESQTCPGIISSVGVVIVVPSWSFSGLVILRFGRTQHFPSRHPQSFITIRNEGKLLQEYEKRERIGLETQIHVNRDLTRCFARRVRLFSRG